MKSSTISTLPFLLLVWLTSGCDDPPTLIYEVDGLQNATHLQVRLKRYLGEGRVEYLETEPVALRDNPEKIQLRVDLPTTGRYAVHFVTLGGMGRPSSDTRCHDVQGIVVDGEVHLSPLSPTVDADNDTFPDDYRLYCAERTAAGLSCESPCIEESFLALVDCNPPLDFVPEEGCPTEIPSDGQVNPFAEDICSDCLDQDCWGGEPPCDDLDGDGFLNDIDCDDTNAEINPGAMEGCGESGADCHGCEDGVDNDCDGTIDEGCFGDDFDNDGIPFDEDCNDCDPGIGPGIAENCGNNVDEDCSRPGNPLQGDLPCDAEDLDGDGHAFIPIGGDCDDTNHLIYPSAPERCNDGISQSCSSDTTCSTDGDGDNFDRAVDCNDADPRVNPWATEICDPLGIDEDCDGLINEVQDPTHTLGCGFDLSSGQWISINFSSDINHCGQCRNRCEGPTWRYGDTCTAGACRCAGRDPCEGDIENWCCSPTGCVDLRSNPTHCGACDVSCNIGESCIASEGDLLATCSCDGEPDGAACEQDGTGCWQCCPGVGCVNVCESLEHCGACGNDCTAGETPIGDSCLEGSCRCGDALETCIGTTFCTYVTDDVGCGCLDLMNDVTNCGACGNECGPNQICQAGTCVCIADGAECAVNEFCCPAVGCVDLQTSTDNCGDCGILCNAGETCTAGSCVCTAECEDGIDCTEGTCTGGRCIQATLDGDDDGYCVAGCLNRDSGGPADCIDGDCDDTNPDVRPGVAETCATAYDDDCDEITNERNALTCTTFYYDTDGDGFGQSSSQCYCEPVDNYTALEPGDCRPSDPDVYPGADELCNGIDDDCDGSGDEGEDDCLGTHNSCSGWPSYDCECDTGWTDCEASCDCNTGGTQYCCDGTCQGSEC